MPGAVLLKALIATEKYQGQKKLCWGCLILERQRN